MTLRSQVVSLQAIGLSPPEAIRAATVRAAELLGWEERVGTLDPGQTADVIGVEGERPLRAQGRSGRPPAGGVSYSTRASTTRIIPELSGLVVALPTTTF